MTSFLVYTHIRPDTGAIFYVGKGTEKRAVTRNSRNRHWHHVVNKAGGFAAEIVYSDIEEAEAFRLERELIAKLRSEGVALCNMTDGGEGASGLCPSEETRAKLRAAKVGRKLTSKHVDAVKMALTGVPKSEAHRRSMAVAQTGKRHSVETRSKTGRAVVCIDTAQTFSSLGLAAEELGVNRCNVAAVCAGRLKQTGGLRFQYASEALST